VFLYFDSPRGARVTLRSLRVRHKNGAFAQPTFVGVTGGLIDGRHRAGTAISKHVAAIPTPTVIVRDDEESEQAEGELEDFLEWKAEELAKGFSRAIAMVGAPPIPFK
jgi:hypothetical protein